jgi:hypothetical protein
MKLHKILLSEQDIRELIQKYAVSLKRNNITRQERYKSMIFVRLADLGFDSPRIRRMITDLTDIDTEKDVDVFMSRYRLWGDDYADTFRATESTINEVDREEDEEGVEQNIHTFKIILQIPFTTKKNKEQKLKKLRFDLKILDVEIKKEKAATVAELNPEEDESDTLLDYAVGLEIETDMTRSEMENNLEPDYKILKIKEV